MKDKFGKRMYVADKFNGRTFFLNSCAFIKRVLYIGTE